MTPGTLSFLYLPPFSIVSRFFLTASLFALLGALLSLYMLAKGSFNLQALVHTYTLGFLGMTMIGALFQMIPVVAGAVIERPVLLATTVHLLLLIGTPLLVLGFLLSEKLLTAGLFFLLCGFGVSLLVMIYKLFRVEVHTPTSKGMRFSLLFFLLALLSGAVLVFTLTGLLNVDYRYTIEFHMSFMLFGWVFLLIASVAFQVIEMFFVTPPYPKPFANYLPWLMGALLTLNALTDFHWISKTLLALPSIPFAYMTFLRLSRRKRKTPDPIVRFWQTGMFMCVASSLLYPLTHVGFNLLLLFLFFFGSFAQSVVMGMMYRIIPFLVWMHLSNRGVPNAPTMHEVIKPTKVWRNFYVHVASILSFLVSFFVGYGVLWLITALLYCLSFGMLLTNLSGAVALYVRRASEQGASPQR